MAQDKSYLNKLKDLIIRNGEFKNDDGEQIAYKQVVLQIVSDGDVEEIVISGKNAPNPKTLNLLLKGADRQDSNFLDEE